MNNKLWQLMRDIAKLEQVSIALNNDEAGRRLHKYFTAPHSKLPIVKRKTLGVALLNIEKYNNPQSYVDSVNGKNSAAYFMRKSQRAGYTFTALQPNECSSEILAIHQSANERQGRSIDHAYTDSSFVYPTDASNKYFGVLLNNELVAYVWCVFTGELVLLNRLMGHAQHLPSGVMYHAVVNTVMEVIADKHQSKYIMYDTMLGATDGLKMFKKRCGFASYKVKWTIC